MVSLLCIEGDVEFLELAGGDFRWRCGHKVGGFLRFWEGYYVADGIEPEHYHEDAVESRGDSGVRRSTEIEGVDEEAEFGADFFVGHFEEFEDFLLDVALMDTNAAWCGFDPIENEVVGWRTYFERVGIEHMDVFGFGGCEGVVFTFEAIFLFVVWEEGEVGYPEEIELFLVV